MSQRSREMIAWCSPGYDQSNGNTSTVSKGGKEVQEALREAFATFLLKIEPKYDVVKRRPFLIDSLKTPRALTPDPALGVRAVRVRKLRLAPPAMDTGFLTIEAPGDRPETSVYDLGDRWFVRSGGKRAKTLNLELTRPNTSDLKDLPEADRKIAETHIERWKLIGPR